MDTSQSQRDSPKRTTVLRNRSISVIAIGGNALAASRGRATDTVVDSRAFSSVASVVAKMASHNKVLVVHGNGPQVGAEWLGDLSEPASKPTSLAEAVAKTQASIGLELATAIDTSLREHGLEIPTAVVLTRVLTDCQTDRASTEKTKPIGYFLNDREQTRARSLGLTIRLESQYGWRVSVESPKPRRVLELEAIGDLLELGHIVIAGGGGGVPFATKADGSTVAIDAVIDKDWTAAFLADELGARLLLILTEAKGIALNFGTREEEWLRRISLTRLQALLTDGDQFEQGSIKPKLEAAVYFLSSARASGSPRRRVVVTDIANVLQALRGQAGTRISN